MWCGICQAEGAAEISSDNRSARCAVCGNELLSSKGGQSDVDTKDARDLLQRWSSAELLDPFGPTIASPQSASNADDRHSHEFSRPTTRDASSLRVDVPHVAAMGATAARSHEVPQLSSAAPGGAHVDRPFDAAPVDIQKLIAGEQNRRSNWQSVIGQVFAYLGILGMFVGTILVLLGYYVGPEKYTATGWLITTSGQMVMFLGVVTLVSAGMEQTTEEVTRKIDLLGNVLIHIEQTAWQHGLAGSQRQPKDATEVTKEQSSVP